MRLKLSILFMTMILVLSACGGDEPEEEPTDEEDQEEVQATTPDEEGAEEEVVEEETGPFVLSDMEETPFEELEGESALKLYTEDWNDPYDLIEMRWELFYGDGDFVGLAADEGIFRYDLESDEVVWSVDEGFTSATMHDGYLYAMQMGGSSSDASIAVIDITNGEIVKSYEEPEYDVAGQLHIFDEHLLFVANNMSADEKDLIAYDRETDSKMWSTPVEGTSGNGIVDMEDGFLMVNDYHLGDDRYSTRDETAFAYDKETGEELFQIEANTARSTPVRNEEGVYFV